MFSLRLKVTPVCGGHRDFHTGAPGLGPDAPGSEASFSPAGAEWRLRGRPAQKPPLHPSAGGTQHTACHP